ncbi:hypothetical protein ABTE55_19055, partial [Acinetobacter baumannii]
RKFIEDVDPSIATAISTDGPVSNDPQQVGSTNADWTKSQAGGQKGVIRSKYVAQMKKKMTRK